MYYIILHLVYAYNKKAENSQVTMDGNRRINRVNSETLAQPIGDEN